MSKKIKTYIFKQVLNDDEVKNLEGEFFDNFKTVIDHDADVYVQYPDGHKEILFHFRKNVIPDNYLQEAIKSFKSDAKSASSIRGASGGKVNVNKLSSNIKLVLNPNGFRSKVIYKDGHISDYYVSNKANSMIAGYFDKSKVSERHNTIVNNLLPCRTTAFTEKKTEKWNRVLPLIQLADKYYHELEPSRHLEQYNIAKLIPKYQISDTAFSTITVNYNWRTANHLDSGDYHNGLSVIMTAVEGKFTGGYLGYPQYDVAVNVCHGDLLLKNPHQWHCNTSITGITSDWTRLSMVLYYREGIKNCMGGVGAVSNVENRKKFKLNMNNGKINNMNINKYTPIIFNNQKINKDKDLLTIYIRPNTTDIKVIDEVLKNQVYKKTNLGFDINSGQLWFDLGGNIGTFSLWALSKGAKTIIYEPEPENIELLRLNLETNFSDKDNNYKIISSAISSKSGNSDLYLCKGDYNKYRHTLYKKRGRSHISVNVLNFHDEMDKYKPYGIKMDIEGSEIDILESITLIDWNRWNTSQLVFEYSFDIDKSIPRFLSIISELKKYFKVVYYNKVKEDELIYDYFPAMTIVYCIK